MSKIKGFEDFIFNEYDKAKGVEMSYAVSLDGVDILAKSGTINSIAFSQSEMEAMRGSILSHNHPSGYSFSYEDIQTATRFGLNEMRAVGVEPLSGKKVVYSMRPGKSGWPSEDRLRIHFNDASEIKEKEFSHKLFVGDMTPDEANARHNDEVWREVASRLNMTYVKEYVK